MVCHYSTKLQLQRSGKVLMLAGGNWLHPSFLLLKLPRATVNMPRAIN